MSFNIAAATNIGTRKNVNQDNYFIKTAKTSLGDVLLAVMCDGMGGLADGEVASSKAINRFNEWFINLFPGLLKSGSCSAEVLGDEMDQLYRSINDELCEYGRSVNAHVGTTATVLLVFNNKYYVFNVGDSRCYHKGKDIFSQITDDDSLAAHRMRKGEITYEEFLTSREKHILMQCVGVNENICVRKYSGVCCIGDVFLLCCDGLYNKLSSDEIKDTMALNSAADSESMKNAVEKLIDTVISRSETDNITGLLINIAG